MSEKQSVTEAPKDNRSAQERHFDEVYAAFLAFYQEKLRTALQPYQRVRLILTTHFFDDMELQRTVHPLFAKFSTTVEDKRAIARAAYYDALLQHKLGRYNDAATMQLFKNDEDLENRIVKLESVAAEAAAKVPKETNA